MILLILAVVFFAGQLALLRKTESTMVRLIPVWVLAAAAVAVSIMYVNVFPDEEQTMVVFGYTMRVCYLAVSVGLAWLVNKVLEKARERKNND